MSHGAAPDADAARLPDDLLQRVNTAALGDCRTYG